MKRVLLFAVIVLSLLLVTGCLSNDPEKMKEDIISKFNEIDSKNQFTVEENQKKVNMTTLNESLGNYTFMYQKTPYYLNMKSLIGEKIYIIEDNELLTASIVSSQDENKTTYAIMTGRGTYEQHHSFTEILDIEKVLENATVKRIDKNSYRLNVSYTSVSKYIESKLIDILENYISIQTSNDYEIIIEIVFDEGYKLTTSSSYMYKDDLFELEFQTYVKPMSIDIIDINSNQVVKLETRDPSKATIITPNEELTIPYFNTNVIYKIELMPGQYRFDCDIEGVRFSTRSDLNTIQPIVFDNQMVVFQESTYYFGVSNHFSLLNSNYTNPEKKDANFSIKPVNFESSPLNDSIEMSVASFNLSFEGENDMAKLDFSNQQQRVAVTLYPIDSEFYLYIFDNTNTQFEKLLVNNRTVIVIYPQTLVFIVNYESHATDVSFNITEITTNIPIVS